MTTEGAFHPSGIGDRVWHYGVWQPFLRLLARDELTVYRRLRTLVNVIVIGAIVLVAFAVVLAVAFAVTSAKIVNIAGLLFDIAGVLRLLLFEQIGESL